MELHQLRYFLAVIEEGTFTAAARAMHINQSGISTQLRKLEQELGVTLIDRSTRRAKLTPAGERLTPYVRAALASIDDVTGVANDIRGLVTGSLRVATITGLTWEPLFDALAATHHQHPGIDLRLHEGTSSDIITQVREGTADVAVVAWAGAPPADVQSMVIFDDALVAVVGAEHPWATRKSIRPSEFAKTDIVALPRGTGARAALENLLSRAGTARVEPRWEVSSAAYVRMLASRGIGVGALSARNAVGPEGVVAVPIGDEAARSQFGVIWRDRPNHATHALLRHLGSFEDGWAAR